MRLGVSMQAVEDTLYDAFGQRQISTIFGQANQYRVILESDPDWQAESRHAAPAARARHQRRAGAVDRDRNHPAHHRAAGGDARAAVSLGDDQLRPGAGLLAGRRRAGGATGRAGNPSTPHHHRQLFRRCRGIPALPGRGAVADPGLGGGDLHRAGGAVRKLDPSADHPVHAALCRDRGVAGADAVRRGFVTGRAGRRRAADGHREEERHHHDRLRDRGRTRRRHAANWRSNRPRCCASGRS